MKTLVKSMLLCCCLLLANSGRLIAQEHRPHGDSGDHPFGIAPIVALDECDPTTFNAAIGPDFCKNVALAPLWVRNYLSGSVR